MNEFLIFNVKEEFYKLYKNKPNELFYIFNRIYNMKEVDKEYGYNLFCQISDFLDKKEISHFIKKRYSDKIMYSNNGNEHVINNLFLSEISIATVKNSNIKIESNIMNPSFIDDLCDLKLHFFVCNFKDQDCYFIKKKKANVK